MGCGYVGVLSVDLHLPLADSLKDKRKDVARLKAVLRKEFACAIAEVDDHDRHRRTRLTLAVVTRDAAEADNLIAAAARRIDADPEFSLIDASRELVAIDDPTPFLVRG